MRQEVCKGCRPRRRAERRRREEPDVFRGPTVPSLWRRRVRNGQGAPCWDRVTLMQCRVPGADYPLGPWLLGVWQPLRGPSQGPILLLGPR